MVAHVSVESSLTLKPSCILPRTFRQGSAPAHRHSLSLPSPLPAPSHSVSLPFLSRFVSLSPSLARLFQYPIFIIRFQLIVSLIVWHRTRSIPLHRIFFLLVSFLFSFLFLLSFFEYVEHFYFKYLDISDYIYILLLDLYYNRISYCY